MSVRQALLALLGEEPKYGYQLRAEFEHRTGAAWPLNVGQVYQTLTRLERDGLVTVAAQGAGDVAAPEAHEAGDRGQVRYAITDLGLAEVDAWFTTAVPRSTPPRDELAIKLAVAVTLPGVDIGRLVQQQRTATMQALQGHMRAKRALGDPAGPSGSHEDLAHSLVLDSLIFDAEAELRWLDHCETRLREAAARATSARAQAAPRANAVQGTTAHPSSQASFQGGTR